MKDGSKVKKRSSHGTRAYFAIAIALISLLPLMSVAYLYITHTGVGRFDTHEWFVLFFGIGCSVVLGYVVQSRYPKTAG